MLNDDVRPSTLECVKRLATQMRKARGLKHSAALDLAAQAAECSNYRHARRTLSAHDEAVPRHYVLLSVYWLAEKGYECGRETMEVTLSKPNFGDSALIWTAAIHEFLGARQRVAMAYEKGELSP